MRRHRVGATFLAAAFFVSLLSEPAGATHSRWMLMKPAVGAALTEMRT